MTDVKKTIVDYQRFAVLKIEKLTVGVAEREGGPANLSDPDIELLGVVAVDSRLDSRCQEFPEPRAGLLDWHTREEGVQVDSSQILVVVAGQWGLVGFLEIRSEDRDVGLTHGHYLGLDLCDVGHEHGQGLVLIKDYLVTDRDTENVVPAIGVHYVVELGGLASVGGVVLVDPDADDDLEVELETLDRVQGIPENIAVGSVETHAGCGLGHQLKLLVHRLLGVEAVGELGIQGHISHAVEDLLEWVVGVGDHSAIGRDDYY